MYRKSHFQFLILPRSPKMKIHECSKDPKGAVVYLANTIINKVNVLHEVEAGTV